MEMTRVTILPVSGASDEKSYHAVAGDKQSFGQTAGEALDALTEQLTEDETNTLVIVLGSLRIASCSGSTQKPRP
jgi:hypothetical protein